MKYEIGIFAGCGSGRDSQSDRALTEDYHKAIEGAYREINAAAAYARVKAWGDIPVKYGEDTHVLHVVPEVNRIPQLL